MVSVAHNLLTAQQPLPTTAFCYCLSLLQGMSSGISVILHYIFKCPSDYVTLLRIPCLSNCQQHHFSYIFPSCFNRLVFILNAIFRMSHTIIASPTNATGAPMRRHAVFVSALKQALHRDRIPISLTLRLIAHQALCKVEGLARRRCGVATHFLNEDHDPSSPPVRL